MQEFLQYAFEEAKKGNPFPITIRGLGSGLSGGATPQKGVVLSLEKLREKFKIYREELYIHVSAGFSTQEIIEEVEKKGLYYPLNLSSSSISSIGGNVATDAGAPRSFYYGKTRSFILALKGVLPTGEEFFTGNPVRKSSVRRELMHLFIGSEGRYGVITEVYLKLLPLPPYREILWVGFPSLKKLLETSSSLRSSPLPIVALEYLDSSLLPLIKKDLPSSLQGSFYFLLIEIEAFLEEELIHILEKIGKYIQNAPHILSRDPRSFKRLYQIRKSITEKLRQQGKKIGEDISLPFGEILSFYEGLERLKEKYGFPIYLWGHLGDANLHCNILFQEEEKEKVFLFLKDLSLLILKHQGSLSGEHGLGRWKRSFLSKEISFSLFSREKDLKKLFDPFLILNPHLVE